MENGVEIAGGSYLSEKKREEDRVFEEGVEDMMVVGERDESKDLEGDEVFEEAIQQLQEHPLYLDLDIVAFGDDGKAESETVVGSSTVVDDFSDAMNEVETFEEAIEVADAGFHEGLMVGVAEKMGGSEDVGKDLNQVANENGVDVTEVLDDKSNGALLAGENIEEKSDDDGSIELDILEKGHEAGIVLENPEHGDLNGIYREVAIVPEENKGEIAQEDDESEYLKGDNLDRDYPNGQFVEAKVFSNGSTLDHEDDESEPKVLTSLEVDHQDSDREELEVNSNYVGNRDSEGAKEVNEIMVADVDHQEDNENVELNGDSAGLVSEIENAKLEESNEPLSEQQYETRELKGASTSSDSLNQENKSEEVKENLSNKSYVDKDDDRSADLKNTSISIESKHHLQSSKPNNSIVVSVEDYKVSPETGSSRGGKILNNQPCSTSEDFKDSQPQKPAGSLIEAHSNGVLSDFIEKNKANDKVENKVIQSKRVEEVQSATMFVSASGRSEKPAPAPATTPASAPTPTPTRPAGLGRAAPLLEPSPRVTQQPPVNGTVSQIQTQLIEDSTANGESEENDETREKLQMIRVKFLRLAHRLGQTPHNVVVAQVLYRLGLAEQLRGRNGGRVGGFSFDRASAMAEQLEAAGREPLDFSCTIMVLGKTGVGKSATINSIFDEVKFGTDAFQLGTKKVQDVVGTVQGIKVRVIDTPGLLPSWSDQRQNEKILLSVKNFMKKTPPDIVLYLDRLDMQSRDFGDMPLLRTITEIFGPSIWFNAIVVLTHAASAPPDGPNGTATSYDMFVTQRSHVVQQAIRGAAADMRLMNPVSLVENHSACRTNRAGQRVLPNGQVWKPHLLLLSFASKILAEANTLLKLQDSPPGQPFATRSRAPPLPFLLSTLLQSRPQLKLPEDQYGDDDNLDDDLEVASDLDEDSEYDELPPFKPLTKSQLSNLTKAQKKAYFDEREYRESLLMKKQLREEKKRRKMMKEMKATHEDLPNDYNDNAEEEAGGSSSVPVPMPDLSLPASFDSDNPTHRYRFLDNSNQWLVRPVLETHGWDHDVGYEGINVERLFAVKEKIPLSFSGQVTKDKKDANLQMEVASLIKHGKRIATSLAVDMQTVGKDMAYTLRSETNFSNYTRNKATAGVSVALLGDALSAGLKLEDKLIVNKCFRLVMSCGAMAGRGDVAYGGSLEATLRDKDYPLGRWLSTLALSVMDWHGDLAIGCNLQSQIPVGRNTNLIARANLNNRGSGQVSVRLNSSEQLQISLIGLLPLFRKIYGDFQQLQFRQR